MVAADGDLVFLHGLFTAKHTGLTLYGIEASGTAVSQPQVHILRFRDSKISDHWVVRDDYVMYRQMVPVEAGGRHPALGGHEASTTTNSSAKAADTGGRGMTSRGTSRTVDGRPVPPVGRWAVRGRQQRDHLQRPAPGDLEGARVVP